MWSDPIADMLTRVRNAVRVRRPEVLIPSSKIKVGIARVLKEEGYIEGFDVIEDGRQGLLKIRLKYGPRGEKIIHRIERDSKPGCRVYRKATDLPRVLDGLGFSMADRQKDVTVLSGGEGSRVALASLMLQPVDLLILDEPTNHLDLPG
ncbi:MAG: 30S ribosomal protein S8, partial [Planctomycetes bacterium]|nr:30S ribosomal protein S8 [Planctomycetota bacterium]